MYPNPTDPLNGDAASLCEYLETKYEKSQIFWMTRHRLIKFLNIFLSFAQA